MARRTTSREWWNKYYLLVVLAAQIIICPIHWASRNFPKAALFQSIYGGVIFSACLFLNHMSLFIISFLMFITQLLNLGIVISTAVGFSDLETLNRVYSVMMYTSDLFSLGQAV
ncbi:hypothetical protein PRIPAC_97338 [Pristionchus pacificus]|nr:hypothetical protein PRIPAC_97338 [Pristionchus pacificus]